MTIRCQTLLIAIAAAAGGHVALAGNVYVVVRSGQHLSDRPPSSTISSVDRFFLSEGGFVAWQGNLNEPPANPKYTVAAGTLLGTHSIAVSGEPAPGAGTAVFDTPQILGVSDNGRIHVAADLTGPDVNPDTTAHGRWHWDGSSLGLLARDGDPIPVIPGAIYWQVTFGGGPGGVGPAGNSYFFSQIVGGPASSSIWSGAPGALLPIFERGTAVPGVPGQVFNHLYGASGSDASGRVITVAAYGTVGGIWFASPAGLTPVAQDTDQAAGFPSGTHLNIFGSNPTSLNPQVSRSGNVVYLSNVLGAPGGNAIFTFVNGLTRRVVGSTDAVPGVPSTFHWTFNPTPDLHAINDSGILAFSAAAGASGQGGRGVWLDRGAGPELIAITNTHAVGFPPNWNYYDLDDIRLNNHGWLVIHGDARDPAGTDTRSCIWVVPPGGQLHALLKEGDPLTVGTDVTTVTSVSLGSLTESDEVAAQVYFDSPGASGSAGIIISLCNTADFNGDGDLGTDADIEAFFACLSGSCCATCESADFNQDGDLGTDADIEAFFRTLAGEHC